MGFGAPPTRGDGSAHAWSCAGQRGALALPLIESTQSRDGRFRPVGTNGWAEHCRLSAPAIGYHAAPIKVRTMPVRVPFDECSINAPYIEGASRGTRTRIERTLILVACSRLGTGMVRAGLWVSYVAVERVSALPLPCERQPPIPRSKPRAAFWTIPVYRQLATGSSFKAGRVDCASTALWPHRQPSWPSASALRGRK
jgi:hypothetical protein